MPLRDILHFPDPRLRIKATPVAVIDDALRILAADMLETMYAAPGIGLAATQINVHKRVIVIDLTEDRSQPQCFVNPELTATSGEEQMEEGCLSIPGYTDLVTRAEKIHLRARGLDGAPIELDADGLLAVCIQHEIDHLDGKLFVDYLSQLKRSRLKKKLEKTQQQAL